MSELDSEVNQRSLERLREKSMDPSNARASHMSHYRKSSLQESVKEEELLRVKKPKAQDFNFFQLLHMHREINAKPREMAEANAFEVIDDAVDEILERGANRLYDSYIMSKIKPYTACYINHMFQSYVCVSSI